MYSPNSLIQEAEISISFLHVSQTYFLVKGLKVAWPSAVLGWLANKLQKCSGLSCFRAETTGMNCHASPFYVAAEGEA